MDNEISLLASNTNNWKGYLLKAVATEQILDGKYILAESWNSTPNQREEIKAYRDDNTRNLTRITAKGMKSVFSFETIDDMNLNEKIAFQNFFTEAESNPIERKITLEFWNDETNDYSVGDFYRPNMNFNIKEYSNNDIIYKSMKFEFVEY